MHINMSIIHKISSKIGSQFSSLAKYGYNSKKKCIVLSKKKKKKQIWHAI